MTSAIEPKTGAPDKDELPVVYLSWAQWQELQARIAELEEARDWLTAALSAMREQRDFCRRKLGIMGQPLQEKDGA